MWYDVDPIKLSLAKSATWDSSLHIRHASLDTGTNRTRISGFSKNP